MTKSINISVIIPAYNAASFIGNAIQSIQKQTYVPIEIIVVDDGSTDDTAQVVARLALSSFFPIRILQQSNSGPAAARNYGAREAIGDWLSFLDADDTFLPEKLEKQIQYTHDPNVGLIHCGIESRPIPTEELITFERLWQCNEIANSTVLIRRTAFEQLGGYDEDRALISVEDYNLWLRLVRDWKIVTCPYPLIRYTPAPGNLSSQVERFSNAEFANIFKIKDKFNLDERYYEYKKSSIYKQYGEIFFFNRNFKMARLYLSKSFRYNFSFANFVKFLITFLPGGIFRMMRESFLRK